MVINRLIAVKSNKSEEYYYIQDGKILSAKKSHRRAEKVNVMADDEALVSQQGSIFDRIKRGIREGIYKLFGKKKNDDQHQSIECMGRNQDAFKRQISDMQNYSVLDEIDGEATKREITKDREEH